MEMVSLLSQILTVKDAKEKSMKTVNAELRIGQLSEEVWGKWNA